MWDKRASRPKYPVLVDLRFLVLQRGVLAYSASISAVLSTHLSSLCCQFLTFVAKGSTITSFWCSKSLQMPSRAGGLCFYAVFSLELESFTSGHLEDVGYRERLVRGRLWTGRSNYSCIGRLKRERSDIGTVGIMTAWWQQSKHGHHWE